MIEELSVDLKRLFSKLQVAHQVVTPLMVKNQYKGITPLNGKTQVAKPDLAKALSVPTLLNVADLQISNFAGQKVYCCR